MHACCATKLHEFDGQFILSAREEAFAHRVKNEFLLPTVTTVLSVDRARMLPNLIWELFNYCCVSLNNPSPVVSVASSKSKLKGSVRKSIVFSSSYRVCKVIYFFLCTGLVSISMCKQNLQFLNFLRAFLSHNALLFAFYP